MTVTSDAGELVHAVGFYGSARELLQMCVPFCEAGVAAGAPTLVSLLPRQAALLRTALDDADEVVFVPHEDQYPSPAGALEALRQACQEHAHPTTIPLRIVGELSPPVGLDRDSWVRYEAAVNHALRGVSARTLCLSHTDGLTDVVQAELERAHPVVVTADGGHHPNPGYRPPARFMAHRLQVVCDPLEEDPAAIDLIDPQVGAVRHRVTNLAATVGLASGDTDNLVVAVSEVATNALGHGRPPVRVRGWGSPGRVVVAVGDAGPGPEDPLAGLRPVSSDAEGSGFGLWIAHQLCSEIAMATTEAGFTVRLAAG